MQKCATCQHRLKAVGNSQVLMVIEKNILSVAHDAVKVGAKPKIFTATPAAKQKVFDDY